MFKRWLLEQTDLSGLVEACSESRSTDKVFWTVRARNSKGATVNLGPPIARNTIDGLSQKRRI